MEQTKQFTRGVFHGVFWTLFIGMAAWIAFYISDKVIPDETGYTVAQTESMALKVEQVMGGK